MKERKNLRAPFASPRQDVDRPTSTGLESKGGRIENVSCGSSTVSKSPTGEKDVTVSTTAGGHLDANPGATNKPSGTLKPTDKGNGTAPLPAASRCTSP
jgi:hypothetical protein